ncbi:beta-1,3-galactosyltransferase 4 [Ambystoma mexicanum]|uniref:beta-1,3-galactosyltransferase 4 n=1 Tax=Ambystoma mexicanum TaxID=8296 RepID=UPI0037E98D04
MRLWPAMRWGCWAKCSFRILIFLMFALLALTLVATGIDEEVLSWSVSPLLVRRRNSELRTKAASFNSTSLLRKTPVFYHIANANMCRPEAPFLVSFVVTAPSNVEARRTIRKTWASVGEVEGHRVLSLFALGMAPSPEVQAHIEEESNKHGDIVQGLFMDTYRNLTLKTIMIMRWAITFCPHARYILKVDDDVYVNLQGMVVHLQSLGEPSEDLYFGRIHWHVHPIRDPSQKYYVPKVLYPGPSFPSYCSGTAYVVSGDVAKKVYVASLEIPFFPMEDVFVGLCTQKLGIPPTHSGRMAGGTHYPVDACCYQTLFTSHQVKPSEMETVWEKVHNGQHCSWLQRRLGMLHCKLLRAFLSH